MTDRLPAPLKRLERDVIEGMFRYGYVIAPVAFIVGGLAVGLVFEKVILKKIHDIAARTKWDGDEILISALRGIVFFWFAVAGLYGAVRSIQIGPEYGKPIDEAILVVVIFSVTVVLARAASGLVGLYSRKVGGILLSTSIFENLTKIIVFLIGILIILQSLGISIAPILTALGVGGLAVALALQDTLTNLFSGIQILASKKIKPGDYLKLTNGDEGYVADITWRYTTIRALSNNMIVIPNSKLSSSLVTNYSLPESELAVLVDVGVSYGSDLEKVEKITCEVAADVMKNVEGGIPEFSPFIRYNTFGDFSINFTVILRAREYVNQYLIKHEFIKHLHRRYQDEGIEIPFPVRTVILENKKD